MTLYSLVLFIHVLAALVLSAGLSFEVLTLFHLRGASTSAEAGPWIEPVPRLPVFAVGSLLVILFLGVYMVGSISTSGRGWPTVGVAALFLMAPFGAITFRRMRAIRNAYYDRKTTNSELLSRLQDPFLKMSLGVRIATFLGIFLLVSVKPGLWESIGLLGGSMALGLLSSLLAWRSSTPLSVPNAGLGTK